jgi:hypothetical protein
VLLQTEGARANKVLLLRPEVARAIFVKVLLRKFRARIRMALSFAPC